jgi:hypothetical protein
MDFSYVYILQSTSHPDRFYTGITNDLKDRLRRHNAGQEPHSAKFGPWPSKMSYTKTARSGVCIKKEFGQQTPRRWGWGTPLKKRAARPNTQSFAPFANKINNFLTRRETERLSVFLLH